MLRLRGKGFRFGTSLRLFCRGFRDMRCGNWGPTFLKTGARMDWGYVQKDDSVPSYGFSRKLLRNNRIIVGRHILED